MNILNNLTWNRTLNQNTEEAGTRELFCKKGEACNFIRKETLTQVFSCEFCEISKNIFFTEHLWATVSGSTELQYAALLKLTPTLALARNFQHILGNFYVQEDVYLFREKSTIVVLQ